MKDLFLPPGVQSRLFQQFGVIFRSASDALVDQCDKLHLERNTCPEETLLEIDAQLFELASGAPMSILLEALGKRRKITRDELAELLAQYASAGGDLCNGYVPGAQDPSGTGDPVEIGRVWARVPQGITFISVGSRLRDGGARYDQPGSMHPLQQADVCFVEDSNQPDTLDYLRAHCRRLILVRQDSVLTPTEEEIEETKPKLYDHRCDYGHRWQHGDLYSCCPECGEPSV